MFPSRCVASKTFYGDMSILPLASWNKFLDVFPSEERFQFIDKILVLFRTEHIYLQFINQHYQNNVFNDRFCQWTEQTEKICDEIKNAGHSLDGIVENLNSEINEITNQISWTAQQTQTQISNVEKALTNLLPNLVSVANSLEQCTGMLANHLDNNNSAK